MHHLQKNYLECIKTGVNDSKFTIGEYHVIAMEIIKVYPVNIFIPVTSFLGWKFCHFAKRGHFDLWSVRGFLQRNQQQILGILCGERKGEKKHE